MVVSTYNKIRLCIIGISLAVFMVSLTQTALTYNDYDGVKTHSSISLLFMGGVAILGGGLFEWLIWLANPLYFLGLFYFYKNKLISLYFSIAATAVSLSFTTWNKILAAENGREASIQSLDIGYWLWLISMLALTIGIVFFVCKLDRLPAKNGSGS